MSDRNWTPNKATPSAGDQRKQYDLTPQEIRDLHRRDDLDFNSLAHHHTLGEGKGQAAPGNHTHGVLKAVKTADEIVNNTTTLQDDNHLFVPVDANAVYTVQMFGRVSGPDLGDFKFSFTVPAGASVTGTARMGDVTTYDTREYNNTALGIQLANNFGVHSFDLIGVLATSATAGILQFQWAQSTATVGDTTVFTSTWLLLMKVSA